MVSELVAIETANALLALSVNAIVTYQKINGVIQQAQKENRPISQAEWDAVLSDANAADARLAALIAQKKAAEATNG